jgi:hypothetical protein
MWNAGGSAIPSKDSAERKRSPLAFRTTSSADTRRAVHGRARDGPGALQGRDGARAGRPRSRHESENRQRPVTARSSR